MPGLDKGCQKCLAAGYSWGFCPQCPGNFIAIPTEDVNVSVTSNALGTNIKYSKEDGQVLVEQNIYRKVYDDLYSDSSTLYKVDAAVYHMVTEFNNSEPTFTGTSQSSAQAYGLIYTTLVSRAIAAEMACLNTMRFQKLVNADRTHTMHLTATNVPLSPVDHPDLKPTDIPSLVFIEYDKVLNIFNFYLRDTDNTLWLLADIKYSLLDIDSEEYIAASKCEISTIGLDYTSSGSTTGTNSFRPMMNECFRSNLQMSLDNVRNDEVIKMSIRVVKA